MWWRIFIPTWRFFDTVAAQPELLIRRDDKWEPALRQPKFHWYSLVFNPEGNYFHACCNLLERLVVEIGEGARPEDLVSFALVRELACGREFKVLFGEQEVLHYRGDFK